MSRNRSEFGKPVKRDALRRAGDQCEGILANGKRCCATLTTGKFHFDHIIPDALGGKPTLDNCAVLCEPCHNDKTRKRDVPAIAEAVRRSDRHQGIKTAPARPFPKGRGLSSPKPKRDQLPIPPRRNILTGKVIA